MVFQWLFCKGLCIHYVLQTATLIMFEWKIQKNVVNQNLIYLIGGSFDLVVLKECKKVYVERVTYTYVPMINGTNNI